MPRIRVFLLTWRRPLLLRRALANLRAQTCSDWICELHNDDPDDDAPHRLVAELADPRIELHQHAQNWGAGPAMRHAYAGGPEPFAALLEDDNWWEPDFLAKATDALLSRPDAALAWSNMRLWREEPDGQWTDTGRTIWEIPPPDDGPREFRWPELLQAVDALHSHGAAVFRPDRFSPIPDTTPLTIIESVREHAALGPLLFLPTPLAHFALTRSTARTGNRTEWLQCKLLLSASFFARYEIDRGSLRSLWDARRTQRPRDTAILVWTALALGQLQILRGARITDLCASLAGMLRHPRTTLHGLSFRRQYPELWSWLIANPPIAREGIQPVRATILDKQPCRST